jgi:hypothetical protein
MKQYRLLHSFLRRQRHSNSQIQEGGTIAVEQGRWRQAPNSGSVSRGQRCRLQVRAEISSSILWT